jgi:maltooligosyltrehalose trehalohydrolase
VPLVFMGEEYGELAPFNYFVSHSDPELVEKVRLGRREEHAGFGWVQDPPDPQDETTFEVSKLDHRLKQKEPHRSLMALYGEILRLRGTDPALRALDTASMNVAIEGDVLRVRRWVGPHEVVCFFNVGTEASRVPLPGAAWRLALDSSDPRWGHEGGGGPVRSYPLETEPASGESGSTERSVVVGSRSFMVFVREERS